MYPAHHTVLSERGAKKPQKTVKVKTAAMLTAEAEAVKHLVEPSDFFKEQAGRRIGWRDRSGVGQSVPGAAADRAYYSGASGCGSECASVAARVLGIHVRDS